MGIRFLCPNGHKLNVKADLAGKRALCPDCGAKLVVPMVAAVTSGPAAPSIMIAGAPAGLSSISLDQPSATIQTNPSASVVISPAPSSADANSAPDMLPAGHAWYVRTAGGGQFGPATDDVFTSWVAEGRVAADAYVWRDDWPDWRLFGNGIVAAPAAGIDVPPIAPVLVYQETATEPTASAPATDNAIAPEAEQAVRRRRTKRNQIVLAIVMLLALLLLAVALVYVIHHNATSVSQAFPPDNLQPARIVGLDRLTYERAV